MTDIVAPAPEPLPLAWDRDRLVVTDPAVLKKLARQRLSASTAKAMDGCPARYIGEKLIVGDENPFDAAPLGTSAHTVMEKVMQLPSGQRTKAMAATFLPDLADGITVLVRRTEMSINNIEIEGVPIVVQPVGVGSSVSRARPL